jgi:hypothetical protein
VTLRIAQLPPNGTAAAGSPSTNLPLFFSIMISFFFQVDHWKYKLLDGCDCTSRAARIMETENEKCLL